MLTRLLFKRHLEDEEQLVTVVHRHWIMGFKTMWLPTLAFFTGWFLLWFSREPLMIGTVAVVELALGIWWLRNFFDYYLDAWIITDKGIIDVAWHGWFHRESSRILYSDIQGVSYEIHGIAGTLLRYGTLSVEKISAGTTVELPEVPRPRSVENIILECMEKYLHKKNLKDSATVQKLLAEFVTSSMQAKEAETEVNKRKPKKTVSGTRRW